MVLSTGPNFTNRLVKMDTKKNQTKTDNLLPNVVLIVILKMV